MYSGASLPRTLYMTKPLLYSGCFCRLIILISFNLWSVVRAVSGKINFTALLCGAEVAMTDDPATRL